MCRKSHAYFHRDTNYNLSDCGYLPDLENKIFFVYFFLSLLLSYPSLLILSSIEMPMSVKEESCIHEIMYHVCSMSTKM